MAGMPRGEICASKNIFKEIRRPVCTDALHVKVMKTKSPLDMCVCPSSPYDGRSSETLMTCILYCFLFYALADVRHHLVPGFTGQNRRPGNADPLDFVHMPRPRSSGIQQHLSGNPCCDARFSYFIF